MKKLLVILIVLVTIVNLNLLAHTTSTEGKLQHFTILNKNVDGYFYMFKNNEVYLENTNHQIVHFPISVFSTENQNSILNKYKKIESENFPTIAPKTINHSVNNQGYLLIEFLLAVCLFFLVYKFSKSLYTQNKMKYVYPVVLIGIATLLISADKKYRTTTDPIQVDNAFIPFKPNVYTHWDNTWFYVESKGIPTTHGMMLGISNHGWQQQIPIPQCYTGSNAWQIPLNSIPAATPIPVNANHFTRGAIALAVNGIPIFNPFTNTGVDALVDGQLDNFGGHCGRADDYHYHTAPLHLYSYTNDTLPIAYALDGFAVFGEKERDGSAMVALDVNHGHNYGGIYHYHGTTSFPYMIGNMVGQITEDTTHQIIPQAHATPIRPSGTPLNGALITGCTPKTTGNGYVFTYTLNGQTYTIDYSWNTTGVYTFNYITPTSTTTDTYTKFAQCNIPNTIQNLTKIENEIDVYPNPTTDFLNINLKGDLIETEILEMSIYNLQGQKVYSSNKFVQHISMKNLANGNYIFKVQIGTSVFSKMINKN
jgi:hypothetical protein